LISIGLQSRITESEAFTEPLLATTLSSAFAELIGPLVVSALSATNVLCAIQVGFLPRKMMA